MRVFVTGASGFIGQAVVKELIEAGHQVLGLVRSDKNAEKITALGAEVHKGSLEDLETLKSGASSSDAVIHLAFLHDFSDFQKCCAVDAAAIEAMGSVLEGTNRPFLVTSGTLMNAKTTPETEPYVAPFAKITGLRKASENLALSLIPKGVHTVIMRLPPTNHGDGDKGFISMLIDVARKNEQSVYIADGLNVWPATHRLDTASAYRLALEKAEAGSIYELAAEGAVTTKSIAEGIGAKLNIPVLSKPREESMAYFGFIGLPMMANNPTSVEKARKELGWNPVHSTLLDDIKNGKYFDTA